jgi:hypothetical protein
LPLGIVFGAFWGLSVCGMGLLASQTAEYGHKFVELMANVYPYYAADVPGALAGLAWGFCDGFGCGIVVWVALNWSVKSEAGRGGAAAAAK